MKKFLRMAILTLVFGITATAFAACDTPSSSLLPNEPTQEETVQTEQKPDPKPILPPDPVAPEPTEPTPTESKTPTDSEPSDPEPSDPEPSDPTPTDPEPSDPTPSEPETNEPEPLPDLNTIVQNITTVYDGTDQAHLINDATWFDAEAMTFTTTPMINAATYTITITRSSDQATAPINLTITPRAITITIDDQSTEVGNDLATLTATLTTGTLVGDDTLNDFYTLSTTADKDVPDTYAITGTATAASQNYQITFIDGTYTVTPALIPENPFTKIGVTSKWYFAGKNQYLIITPTDDVSGTYYIEGQQGKYDGTYTFYPADNQFKFDDSYKNYDFQPFTYEIVNHVPQISSTKFYYPNSTFVFLEYVV